MNSGIYSLIARDKDTNELVVLPIKELRGEQVRTKVNISSIDMLTTYFENEEVLTRRLYDKKYINFINADIFIRYNYNKETHDIDLLYKPHAKFRELITNSETTMEITNEVFIQGCDRFFLELNNPSIRNYVLNNTSVNLKLKQYIEEMYKTKTINDYNFYKKKIIESLSNYRDFRNLTLVINDYYNPELVEQRQKKIKERQEAVKEQQQEKLFNTMNINIFTNYDEQVNYETSKEYEDAKAWQNEEKNINEMLDLDTILSMPADELRQFGIDKNQYIEYGKKIYK